MCGESIERVPEQVETAALAEARMAVSVSLPAGGPLPAFIERYRLAADHSAEAVFVLDADRRFAYLNSYCRQLLGYGTSELLGERLERLAAPETTLQLAERMATEVRGAEPMQVELRQKSGGAVWLELSATPIVEDGQLLGWVGSGRDITAQRRAQQRLLRANRELSAVQIVVAEATQAIDLQATLDTTLEQVLELIDAEAGAILIVDRQTQRLSVMAHRGFSRAAVADLRDQGRSVREGLFAGAGRG